MSMHTELSASAAFDGLSDGAGEMLKSLIHDPATREVWAEPVRQPASEVLRVWETRLRNTSITGRPIHGAAGLVDYLRHVAGATEIQQIGLVNESLRMTGNVFLAGRHPTIIGATIVAE